MITRIQKALAVRRERLRETESGFTLIELLVVVIIIGILAAIAIPVYVGVQNNAKDSAVQSDLTNLKSAVLAYQADTQATGTPPTLNSTNYIKYGYTNSGKYSVQPAFASGSTVTVFCIKATSTTTKVYYVTSSLGVSTTDCGTDTTKW